jgi:hypothetical protein
VCVVVFELQYWRVCNNFLKGKKCNCEKRFKIVHRRKFDHMYARSRARFPDEVSSKARRDRSFKDVRSSADSPARGLRHACALFF